MTTSSAAPGKAGFELQFVATSQKPVPSVQFTTAASAAAAMVVRSSSATVALHTETAGIMALALFLWSSPDRPVSVRTIAQMYLTDYHPCSTDPAFYEPGVIRV
jgi:hypothetical protein